MKILLVFQVWDFPKFSIFSDFQFFISILIYSRFIFQFSGYARIRNFTIVARGDLRCKLLRFKTNNLINYQP